MPMLGGAISDGIGILVANTIASENTFVSVLSGAISGLPLALLIADGKMLVFLVGVLASYVAGYFFTSILGFEDPVE